MKLFNPFAWLAKTIKNRYEAATWQWGARSFLFGSNQDARFDADNASRTEIMRKARYFEKNNAFIARLLDVFEQYTVGADGLAVVSKSKDSTDYFVNWSKTCDVTSDLPLAHIEGLMARGWFVDGESFAVKTMVNGRPKIQVIEAHRCFTPRNMRENEGKTVIDGVGIDSNGCPTGYWFDQTQSGNNYSNGVLGESMIFIPAENVIHVFEPSRAGMYRGISFLHACVNDLHDMDDLQQMVMQVCKQAASIGNVTTNKTGEFDPAASRRAAMKIQSFNQSGAAVTKTTDNFYNVKLGSQEIALMHGDDIKQFQANRPSLMERELWDYQLSKVCCAVGISKLLCLPYSMQGTVTRADLDIAAAFFRSRSKIIQAAVAKIYLWVCEWAQDYDREVIRGGMDFAEFDLFTVRAPRSPNVDVGRNSKALIAEFNAGLRTAQDIFAESGQDWREQFEQKAIEASLIKELSKKYGVDENDIAERIATPNKGAGEENVSDENQSLK